MGRSTGLVFNVRRCEPELVPPAKATPREFKQLSHVDLQVDLQFQMPFIRFYAHDPSMQGRDPVKVIREALAQALVFYYPLAGRLRETGPNKELIVDCTGEGVLFIEADADVRLEQFGDPIYPPFPCFDQLLYNVPGSDGIVNCPLMLFQVTRLKCGGFIVAKHINHIMCDGAGDAQFLNALGEIARGAHAPSTLPVWQREAVLNPRNLQPRNITSHQNADADADDDADPDPDPDPDTDWQVAHRCFFIGPKELANIHRLMTSDHSHPYSRFEVLSACIWRCYALAFAPHLPDPDGKVGLSFTVNARSKFNPPLPKGYYGNVIAEPLVITTVGKLCLNPIGHALELIRNAKRMVTEDYMRSLTSDPSAIKDRPRFPESQIYSLSDITHIGLDQLDFGWGKPVYSGPPLAWADGIPGAGTYFVPFRTKEGEQGTLMIVSLRAQVLERFTILFKEVLKLEPVSSQQGHQYKRLPPTTSKL